jgi:Ni/Co efflux regulator RcnB
VNWTFAATASLVLIAGSVLGATEHPSKSDPPPSHRTRSDTATKPPRTGTANKYHRAAPAPPSRTASRTPETRPRRPPPQGPAPRAFAAARRFDWNTYRPGVQPPLWNRYRADFNIHKYQRNYIAARRFHYRPYIWPAGVSYRRWVYGQIFPRPLWVQDYWLTDYWMYGLIDPPYGFVWVRYDDDAVLLSVQTGLIIRVVYNLFY